MFSGIFFHGLVFEAESEPSLVLILKRFDQFDENGVGQSFRIALIRLGPTWHSGPHCGWMQ